MGLLDRMESRVWADGVTVSYRYHPVGGKPTAWTKDRDACMRSVLDMNGQHPGYGSMAWLWDQWRQGRRWAKLAPGTQADYVTAWKQIEQRFGKMPAASLTAPLVARYVHIERATSPRRADIEKTLLSNLFRHGIMAGVCELNPTIGVEPRGSEPSDVMPGDADLRRFLAWLETQSPQRRIIGMAAEYAALAGSRRIEFLDLAWPQVDRAAGVVRTKRAKQRGKRRGDVVDVVAITPRLGVLLDRLKALGRDCLYVFPTQGNNAYTTEGFETLWGRCMVEAVASKIVMTRFNFHALRRHYVTMHKAQHGTLPNLHADARITSRVYDATTEEKRAAL